MVKYQSSTTNTFKNKIQYIYIRLFVYRSFSVKQWSTMDQDRLEGERNNPESMRSRTWPNAICQSITTNLDLEPLTRTVSVICATLTPNTIHCFECTASFVLITVQQVCNRLESDGRRWRWKKRGGSFPESCFQPCGISTALPSRPIKKEGG